MAGYELKPLSRLDGEDVYHFLQSIPADENGFMNSAAGLSYDAYKQWLVRQEANAIKTEIEDGWRVPSGTWWFFVDGRPVGMVKLRSSSQTHFVRAAAMLATRSLLLSADMVTQP